MKTKANKYFRIREDLVQLLTEAAEGTGLTETKIVEDALEFYAKPTPELERRRKFLLGFLSMEDEPPKAVVEKLRTAKFPSRKQSPKH